MDMIISTVALWIATNWEHIAAIIGVAAFIANKLPPEMRDNANAVIRFITWLLDQLGHNYGNTANAGVKKK